MLKSEDMIDIAGTTMKTEFDMNKFKQIQINTERSQPQLARGTVFSLVGQPNVHEYDDCVVVDPHTVPKYKNFVPKLDDVEYYQMRNRRSQVEQTKAHYREGVRMFQTTRDQSFFTHPTRQQIRDGNL